MTDILFWVDVETLGLERELPPLQVAAIVTDLDGNQLDEPFERVIRNRNNLRSCASEPVREMHDATKLWERLPNGTPLKTVETELLEYLKRHAPEPRQARIAGSSVHFDLKIIEHHLAKVYQHLHYRVLDVSGLAFALKTWGVIAEDYPKKRAHEALSDINESISEYLWLKKAAQGFDKS